MGVRRRCLTDGRVEIGGLTVMSSGRGECA